MRVVVSIAVVVGLAGLGACSNTALPTATQAVCPSPAPDLTWDNFGQKFMADYCTSCHASTLLHAQRNGAPLFHDYDSLHGVLSIPDHIDKYAGAGPAAVNTLMPPGRCPSTPGGSLDRDCPEPTDAERTNLSLWLACQPAQ
ncbi:MAG: hypothetical protein ABIY55_09955 [Kofleriaceae bacterium]